eukprot:m.1527783 g.1527783  ORF g.1527783 m.1527783 type:complete len:50 (+) comp25235_c0_seq5:655-804(+)
MECSFILVANGQSLLEKPGCTLCPVLQLLQWLTAKLLLIQIQATLQVKT